MLVDGPSRVAAKALMHSVRKWTRLDGNHGTVSGRCRALFRDLSSAGTLRRKEGFILLREARQCFSRHGNVTGRFVRVARICIRDRSRNIRFLRKISENDQDSGNFRALSTYLDRRTEIDALVKSFNANKYGSRAGRASRFHSEGRLRSLFARDDASFDKHG